MLVCKFKIQRHSSLHCFLWCKGNVYRQVLSDVRARQCEKLLVVVNNFVDACQTFIARGLEVQPPGLDARVVPNHPHRKDKTESGVLTPQACEIPNIKSLARKSHPRIADDQGPVIVIQHPSQVRSRCLPRWVYSKELPKNYLYKRCRSSRRLIKGN